MSKKEAIFPAVVTSDVDYDEIGTEFLGCHVAKRWGDGVVRGTVIDSGLRKRKGHFFWLGLWLTRVKLLNMSMAQRDTKKTCFVES